LNLGEERLSQGNNQKAGYAFQAVLAKDPNSAQAARAMWGMVRAESASGRKISALEWAQRLIVRHPGSPFAVEADLFAARLEMEAGQNKKAAGRLQRLLAQPPSYLSAGQRRQAQQLLAESLQEGGKPQAALRALLKLAQEGGPSTAIRLFDKIEHAAAKLSSGLIEPLLSGAAPAEAKAALLLGLGRAQLREGKLWEVKRTLDQLRGLPQAKTWSNRIHQLEQQLSHARLVKPRSIGLILPLSGPYASQGRQVRDAVQLGLGLFNGSGSHPPTLHIADSHSDPKAAAAAVSRLASQHQVMAIIGPMGRATSLAAARRAQQLGVPLISLSQVEGVTNAGEYIFQNFYSPQEQVAAVLDEVMGKRGKKRFAILAPSNAYGQGFSRLFAREAAARGGDIIRTIYYDPRQKDFKGDVQKLVKLPPGNYRPGRPDSPKPVIDFQALFIPDGPERAGILASLLAYYDVVEVDLAGTSLWHDDKLPKIAGRYLKNTIIPDAFDPASSRPEVKKFVSDYNLALGKEPNVLDAHGYDAAVLLRRVMDSPQPPRTRQEMRRVLAGLQAVPGVCGSLSLGPDRRVRKKLTLFTVRDGRFVTLDSLPQPVNPLSPAPSESSSLTDQ
jgi:ABC-type branched-subunit amino acid transport system substrate-binding protein